MIPRVLLLIILPVLYLSSGAASGHHSYAAEFDGTKPVTIEGTVHEVWFRNPHIRYYVMVKDAQGQEELWDTRGLAPVKLMRLGWTKDTIKAGDRIVMHGHLGRYNKTLLAIVEIILPDGRVLSSKSSAYDLTKSDQ